MARGVPPQGAGGGRGQQSPSRQPPIDRKRQAQYSMEVYWHRRTTEAAEHTEEAAARVAELESILVAGLARSPSIDLDALYQQVPASGFAPDAVAPPEPAPTWEEFAPSAPPLPGWLVGRWQRQREVDAQARFARAYQAWEDAQERRAEALAEAREEHDDQVVRERQRVEQYNSRIARVAAGLRDRDPVAVESFLRTVLSRMPLPAGFPRRWEVTHDPQREHVTLRLVLPRPEVVPRVAEYDYHESSDEFVPVPRSVAECSAVYHRVLAQVALLATRDVLQAEQRLAGVTVAGLVDVPDPVTGAPAFGLLLRLDADPTRLTGRDLQAAPPEEILRELGAQVSPDPYGLRLLADAPGEDPLGGTMPSEDARGDGLAAGASVATGEGSD